MSEAPADKPLRIEDYALIGDGRTAALVGRNGSIDWLCLPRFDGGACFAALLGDSCNGRWLLAPAAAPREVSRAYAEGTLVLETRFRNDEGEVAVIDLMPVGGPHSSVVRLVEGRRGRVRMRMELVLRFDYGRAVPWVTRLHAAMHHVAPDGMNGICAIAGPDMAVLRTPVRLEGRDMTTEACFEVGEGERIPFVLTHSPSHEPIPPALDAGKALRDTEAFWRDWSGRCEYQGEWREAVLRSLLTLKALNYAPTGGIVAAPTTSLPEQLGGPRNWDYRYCWLRDATLTLLALMRAGYCDEAQAWRDWLHRAVAGSPDQLQIMYGLAGERRLDEWEVPWLAGYEGSRPVRIGNAAATQLQLDVYGEVVAALCAAHERGLRTPPTTWELIRVLVDHLATIWREPDEGMWEVRGGPRQFTFSKIMAWVAVDRAVRGAEAAKLDAPLGRWRSLRDEIHATVCKQGWSERKQAFTQSFGSEELDASLLLIGRTGFLPQGDARVRATVEAIRRELTVDGFVLRYRPESGADGLPGGEGAFLACSFWLAGALADQGRREEARELFERLLGLRNDVGLLAEEYDPGAGRLVGNFPQAFSHVALVVTAFALSGGRNGAEPGRRQADGSGA